MSFLKKKQKHKEQSKLSDESKESIEASEAQSSGIIAAGLNCDVIPEPVPKFNKAPCERVIEGKNNSWIVLGRDRPYSLASGYGGSGGTQCGMIDLVVGRRPLNSETVTNPNFISDAARIYVSQRTDIDNHMQLVNGRVGQSVSRSAIGMKADDIRIVARRGIKIVTGVDRKNSRDEKNQTVLGIDLIAGNYDGDGGPFGSPGTGEELQPICLGKNTADCIESVVDNLVGTLQGIVSDVAVHLNQIYALVGLNATALVPLTFGAQTSVVNFCTSGMLAPDLPFFAPGASPTGTLAMLGKVQTLNTKMITDVKGKYLTPTAPKYIGSRNNRTN